MTNHPTEEERQVAFALKTKLLQLTCNDNNDMRPIVGLIAASMFLCEMFLMCSKTAPGAVLVTEEFTDIIRQVVENRAKTFDFGAEEYHA